ncbi:hypothetical protein GW17_00019306 [Ensete ventricosum]|nr:hypothetical protein GW17_00019306 [Ensete ventricosum]
MKSMDKNEGCTFTALLDVPISIDSIIPERGVGPSLEGKEGGRLGGAALSVDNHRPVDAVVACGPKDSERAWEQVTLTRDRETEGVAWEGLAFLGRRLGGAWAGSWGRFLFDRIRVGTARSDCLDGYAGPIGCLILC